MRFFNAAGPVNCDDQYCLPPLERFDLDEILSLIDQKKCFILNSPRQTGKTSCLLTLTDYLNRTGRFRALYFNVELAQSAREDVARGMRAVLSEMASGAIRTPAPPAGLFAADRKHGGVEREYGLGGM